MSLLIGLAVAAERSNATQLLELTQCDEDGVVNTVQQHYNALALIRGCEDTQLQTQQSTSAMHLGPLHPFAILSSSSPGAANPEDRHDGPALVCTHSSLFLANVIQDCVTERLQKIEASCRQKDKAGYVQGCLALNWRLNLSPCFLLMCALQMRHTHQ